MDWKSIRINIGLLIMFLLFSFCIGGILGLKFHYEDKTSTTGNRPTDKTHRWVVFDSITQIPITPPCVNKQLTACGITVSKCEGVKESLEFTCLTNVVVVDLAE